MSLAGEDFREINMGLCGGGPVVVCVLMGLSPKSIKLVFGKVVIGVVLVLVTGLSGVFVLWLVVVLCDC